MQVKPFKDSEQDTPPPEGRLIGFANTKEELDAVVGAFHSAGCDDSRITILAGETGIERLKNLDDSFFFSDPEYQVVEFGLKELEAGHYSIGVEVDDRDSAAALSELATRFGGHSFQYIGPWVSERFTK